MALTYAETAALINNAAFRDRVKVACLKYADYITNEAPNVTAHSTRIKWAQSTLMNPEVAVNQVIPTVVMDSQVQADGEAISDGALQSSVEAAVNKLI